MRLGNVIRKYRRASDISLRDLAIEIGLPLATMQRVEVGKALDGKTVSKVLLWLLEPGLEARKL